MLAAHRQNRPRQQPISSRAKGRQPQEGRGSNSYRWTRGVPRAAFHLNTDCSEPGTCRLLTGWPGSRLRAAHITAMLSALAKEQVKDLCQSLYAGRLETKTCIILFLQNPSIKGNCSFASKQSASGGAVPPGSHCDLHLPLRAQTADELEQSAQDTKRLLPERCRKEMLKGQGQTCSTVPLAGADLRTTQVHSPGTRHLGFRR